MVWVMVVRKRKRKTDRRYEINTGIVERREEIVEWKCGKLERVGKWCNLLPAFTGRFERGGDAGQGCGQVFGTML